MRRKIPSTRALLAFEAAGRHGNFARAAEELCLSEGAISRQISRLEAELGLFLFNRVKGRIHLTDAGRIYLEGIRRHLDGLEQDTINLHARPDEGGLLNVAVLPTFASKWLIPLLPRFQAQYPGVVINVSERSQPFNFEHGEFHAAIQFDHPARSDMIKADLFEEEIIPVCHPDVVKRSVLRQPCDVKTVNLLHKRNDQNSWRRWCDKYDVTDINPVAGSYFEMYSMVVDAALAGLGIGLVPKLYAQQKLLDGRLVAPFGDLNWAEKKRYCIDYPAGMHGSWPLQPFVAWLKTEAVTYVKRRSTQSNILSPAS